MKRIATHAKPDPDAIAATWLAEAYLFPGEDVEVVFVPRGRPVPPGVPADCVVDVSNTYDPDRLVFDHKPPAFEDRNATCATKLVWEYLRALGRPVGHLAALVAVVHEGDRSPPRRPSPELARSRAEGFHAHFARMRACHAGDRRLYLAMRDWLDRRDSVRGPGRIAGRRGDLASPGAGVPRIRADRELARLVIPRSDGESRAEGGRLVAEDGGGEPVVIWAGHGIVLSGLDRYAICRRRGLAYRVEEVSLPDRHAAARWVIADQLARLRPDSLSAEFLRGMRVLVEVDAARPGELVRRRREAGGWLHSLSFAQGGIAREVATRLAREYGVDGPAMRAAARLAEAIELIGRNCGARATRLMLAPGGQLRSVTILKIARKGPERQRYALKEADGGRDPLARPARGDWPMDTRNFAKIPGRLGRALGHVERVIADLPRLPASPRPTRGEEAEIRGHAAGIVAASRQLLGLIPEPRGKARERTRTTTVGPVLSQDSSGVSRVAQAKTFAQVRGCLDAAHYFVEKTARDVRRLPPGTDPTPEQAAKIRSQLDALIGRTRGVGRLLAERGRRRGA